MDFNPCNRILEIREYSTTKIGIHLGVGGFIPGSMKCDSRASLLTRTLVSLCLGHKPKVRVATNHI